LPWALWRLAGTRRNAYQGKFTPSFETHWGGATLPAGDYTLQCHPQALTTDLLSGGQVNAIIMAASTDDRAVRYRGQLNLVDIGDVQTVQTFDAPELGLTLVYPTPTQKHVGHKEAQQKTAAQTPPTTMLRENRTSIAVHAAGR
jgi:hypothetical protein